MKRIFYYTSKLVLCGALLFSLTSCEKFLDEMPDNRTELDSPEKVKQMLVSAYSSSLPVTMQELMSDNATDYSRNLNVGYDIFQEAYLFAPVTGTGRDTPDWIWEDNYAAISSANHALEAMEKLGLGDEMNPQRGEALMCRAYAHFTLVNAFSQAYNTQSSNQDMGIPYITEPEKTVFSSVGRGTVAEVYEMIAKDIEAGYPMINDDVYAQPKFHFTRKAAACFAAQFYLYYGNYEKAIEYANEAIGEDPTSLMRNWALYTGTSSDEYTNTYVATEEPANIFCHGFTTVTSRARSYRYIHTNALLNETLRSRRPWSSYVSNGNIPAYSKAVYVISQRSYFMPKTNEFFMYTDIANNIGWPYVVVMMFTTEKTILDRAEAYALMGDFENAMRDLNYFYKQAGMNHTFTLEEVTSYYESANELTKKPIAPRFTVEPGTQENLIHAILHARRLVTLQEGTRLQDLKRYGIAYTHYVDGADNIEIEPYDKRLAIQLPAAVISAGLQANPR